MRAFVSALMGALWLCGAAFAAERGSLFPAGQQVAALTNVPSVNLLQYSTRLSFLAPLPAKVVTPSPKTRASGDAGRLLDLIAQAEAGSMGYNAVQHGARIRPTKAPTDMTLGEIYAWIVATPRQPHAIGRYQFIPKTLRRVAAIRGYGPDVRFTPEVQDSLAEVLLVEAGIEGYRRGTIGKRQFMHSLAQIWAGLPLPNGKSYYDGYAGNKATMSWPAFYDGVNWAFARAG